MALWNPLLSGDKCVFAGSLSHLIGISYLLTKGD